MGQPGAEAYTLDIGEAAALVRASGPRGAFWALQTLVGLLTPGRGALPCMQVRTPHSRHFALAFFPLDVIRLSGSLWLFVSRPFCTSGIV